MALAMALVAVPAVAQSTDATVGQTSELDVPAPPADANLPQVEPVISEEEFDETIPELDSSNDPALDAPLESIEDFERRVA